MSNLNPPRRGALYVRSLHAHDDDAARRQELQLRAAASARPESTEISHTFREDGDSGFARDLLVAAVRAGEVDLVMVSALACIARSASEYADLQRLLDAHGVGFVALSPPFDTTTPVGMYAQRVVGAVAELG